MRFFECCHICKPPKRHPGCHGNCPEYIKDKESWDERNETIRRNRAADIESEIVRVKLAKFNKR